MFHCTYHSTRSLNVSLDTLCTYFFKLFWMGLRSYFLGSFITSIKHAANKYKYLCICIPIHMYAFYDLSEIVNFNSSWLQPLHFSRFKILMSTDRDNSPPPVWSPFPCRTVLMPMQVTHSRVCLMWWKNSPGQLGRGRVVWPVLHGTAGRALGSWPLLQLHYNPRSL